MKTMKKLLASLLLIAMLASLLTVGAMADNGTVQVTGGTVIGDVYSFYKILELDEDNSAADKPLFKVDADWTGFAATGYYTVDSATGYVIKEDSFTESVAPNFAVLAKKYATDNHLSADVTSDAVIATGATMTKELAPGYYLMIAKDADEKDRMNPGIVQVLPGETTPVTAKDNVVGLPTMEKKVSDVNDPEWSDTNDVAIGSTVKFRITIETEAAGKDYVLTDTLGAGFTLDTTSIEVVGVDAANYTLDTSTANKLVITFKQDYLNTLKANDKIVVEYSATLNTNATIADTGNTNAAVLTFTGGDGEAKDSTTTYTYEIDLKKIDTVGIQLEGAKFKLSDGTKDIDFVKITGGYRVAIGGETPDTLEAGNVKIVGLDAGTYTLVETEAPKGYIKSSETYSVTLSETTRVKSVEVTNIAGVEMPSTGGVGTTIFYCIGGLLVLAAAVVLITRRRVVED